MVFNLQSGHGYIVEMAVFNICYVKRAATPKVGYPELRFLGSAPCLMVPYIIVKFHNNILNGFQLTVQIRVHGRNSYVQCSKGNNSRSRQTRVMVHMFCMWSYSALYLCEVSRKYLLWYQSYRADTNDGSTDRPMDWQMDRHSKFRTV